jgi:hypothetical protein
MEKLKNFEKISKNVDFMPSQKTPENWGSQKTPILDTFDNSFIILINKKF